MSNGSEQTPDHPSMGKQNNERITVHSYSTMDEKIYYFHITEKKAQLYAEQFPTEIFFTMSLEDAMETDLEAAPDNLKRDFVYYHPVINGASWWQCTCNNFLESDIQGEVRMLKRVVSHARKTGHTIHPRGN